MNIHVHLNKIKSIVKLLLLTLCILSCNNKIECKKTLTKGLYNCKCLNDTNVQILVIKDKLELIKKYLYQDIYTYRINNNSIYLQWYTKENKSKTKLIDIKFQKHQISIITKYNKITYESLERKKFNNSYKFSASYNLLKYNYSLPIYFYETDLSGHKMPNYFIYNYYPKIKMYEIYTDNENFKNSLSLDSINLVLAESYITNIKFEKNLEFGILPIFDHHTILISNSLKIHHRKKSKLTGEIVAYHNDSNQYPIAYRQIVFNGSLMQRFDNFEKECRYYDDKFKTGSFHSDNELKDKIADIGILIKNGKFSFTEELKQAIKNTK